MALTDKQLLERDARRDIGAELLGAVREAKAGHWARKTVFAVQPDGAVQRRIERADGTVEKEELGKPAELASGQWVNALNCIQPAALPNSSMSEWLDRIHNATPPLPASFLADRNDGPPQTREI